MAEPLRESVRLLAIQVNLLANRVGTISADIRSTTQDPNLALKLQLSEESLRGLSEEVLRLAAALRPETDSGSGIGGNGHGH